VGNTTTDLLLTLSVLFEISKSILNYMCLVP